MRICKHANLRIGENKAAHEIVSQITLDRAPERFVNQTAPRLARDCINIKPARHFFFRDERLKHRIPNLLGKNARQIVELFHLLEFGVASGQIDNRFSTYLPLEVAQNQSAMLTVVNVRRKRGNRASAQLEIQAEVANDFLW